MNTRRILEQAVPSSGNPDIVSNSCRVQNGRVLLESNQWRVANWFEACDVVGGRELPCPRVNCNPQRLVRCTTLSTLSNLAAREPVVEINCDTRTSTQSQTWIVGHHECYAYPVSRDPKEVVSSGTCDLPLPEMGELGD